MRRICITQSICGLVPAATILLSAGLADAGPIMISGNDPDWKQAIVQKGQLLVDTRGDMDLATARNVVKGWTVPNTDALNFGYSKAAYWVRWTIANGTPHAIDMVIDLGNPREDNVTWYLIRQGGHIEQYATGDRHPFRQRPLDLSRNFALPVSLAAQERVTVYLHLKSHDGFYEPMPVTLYREHSF